MVIYYTYKQVCEITNLSRSSLARMERDGRFPKRIVLSIRRVGWVADEVLAWDKVRREERQKKVPETAIS